LMFLRNISTSLEDKNSGNFLGDRGIFLNEILLIFTWNITVLPAIQGRFRTKGPF